MSLPKFNESGDLPEGIHSATLDETIARFGSGTAKREEVIGVTQLGRGFMERGRPGRSWVGALRDVFARRNQSKERPGRPRSIRPRSNRVTPR